MNKFLFCCFQDVDDLFEGIKIPLHEIFSRMPSDGNLKKILAIKNKRFHQMNVFGMNLSEFQVFFSFFFRFHQNSCILNSLNSFFTLQEKL